jgi:hypothetical protein
MNEDFYLSPDDFIIRVEPVFSEDGEWASEVEINICYNDDNTLDEDDFETLFTLTHLICSSLSFFTHHPEIMSLAKNYMDKEQAAKKDGTSIESILNKRFTHVDNVVKVNFKNTDNVISIDFKNKED